MLVWVSCGGTGPEFALGRISDGDPPGYHAATKIPTRQRAQQGSWRPFSFIPFFRFGRTRTEAMVYNPYH
jgi:hypothetical protein